MAAAQTIDETVENLGRAFRRSIKDIRDQQKLQEIQVDFCYLIDDIQRGPIYDADSAIERCWAYVRSIAKQEKQEHTAA